MTILCGPKWLSISQSVLGKSATGVPQQPVSTKSAPWRTSRGTLSLSRGQNQTLTPASERSIAYQPPPFSLNVGPYESAVGFCTLQPALEVV